jgi:alpha-tubulin suppressor-like RCC1 family protein
MTRSARAIVLLFLLGFVVARGGPLRASAADPKAAGPEEEATQIVVMIEADLGGTLHAGAGILIGQDAQRWYIATATHLVREGEQEARSIAVQFRWLPTPVSARLARAVPRPLDLAVLTVERSPGIDAVADRLALDRLGNPERASRGDAVFALGQPFGKKWGVSVGADRISLNENSTLYFESTSIAPGHSGGALLNDRGELLGMILTDQPPQGAALGITRLLAIVRDWSYPVALRPRFDDAVLATLSAGANFTCALNQAGAIYCWGDNSTGNLGNGSTQSTAQFVRAAVRARFVSVSAGFDHACGVTISGAAFCWGSNDQGQLGNGAAPPQAPRPIPAEVAGQLRFVAISAGFQHTCGVTVSGAAYCWGNNDYGQLGDGTRDARTAPTPVQGGLRFRVVSAGTVFSCGITTDGRALCWGANTHGRLGSPATGDTSRPLAVSGGLTFVSVSAGNTHACGLSGEGTVYCWGSNGRGELGQPGPPSSTRPLPVSPGSKFRSVSAGRTYTCGVTLADETYCWGFSHAGFVDATTPTRLFAGQALTTITAGMVHACGRAPDDTVYCVGNKLGNGADVERITPVVILLPE